MMAGAVWVAGDAQGPHEIRAGPGIDHAEGKPMSRGQEQSVDYLIDRAVAADGHNIQVVPSGSFAGQFNGMPGALGEHDIIYDAQVFKLLFDVRPVAEAGAIAGGGVNDYLGDGLWGQIRLLLGFNNFTTGVEGSLMVNKPLHSASLKLNLRRLTPAIKCSILSVIICCGQRGENGAALGAVARQVYRDRQV